MIDITPLEKVFNEYKKGFKTPLEVIITLNKCGKKVYRKEQENLREFLFNLIKEYKTEIDKVSSFSLEQWKIEISKMTYVNNFNFTNLLINIILSNYYQGKSKISISIPDIDDLLKHDVIKYLITLEIKNKIGSTLQKINECLQIVNDEIEYEIEKTFESIEDEMENDPVIRDLAEIFNISCH